MYICFMVNNTITEHEEFKTQLAANKKGLIPYDADIYNEAYISGAVFTQHLMQKEHDREMEEFEVWKLVNFVALVNKPSGIKCYVGKEGGFVVDYPVLLDLFRKERGNDAT